MQRRCATSLIAPSLVVSLAVCSAACGAASPDGAELPMPYDSLRGGIIFATRALRGSAGYDLYWTPLPDVSVGRNVPLFRLTESTNNEYQPAVSGDGAGMAFAGEDGIYVITSPEGRISRITDTTATTFVDTLPAVSYKADRVAWVRADTSRPIGETGFVESYIMIANFDGTDVHEVGPTPGVIQDAPAFDPRPDPNATRLAWSEFDAASVAPNVGPTVYGIWVYDYRISSGTYVCRSINGVTPELDGVTRVNTHDPRCFGQHLVWPVPDTLVLSQTMLEIDLLGRGKQSPLAEMLKGYKSQQDGIPVTTTFNAGFYASFPVSSSYSADGGTMVFDGVIQPVDAMNFNTLQIFVAASDGTQVTRLLIDGYGSDIDTNTTNNYLFSVATPRIVPR